MPEETNRDIYCPDTIKRDIYCPDTIKRDIYCPDTIKSRLETLKIDKPTIVNHDKYY
jgi:hypothetical protein